MGLFWLLFSFGQKTTAGFSVFLQKTALRIFGKRIKYSDKGNPIRQRGIEV